METSKIRLYWSPQTRASRAVWMLEEAGVDYELVTIDIRAPDRQDSPEFRAASPMGKVPALADGDARLSESAAICLYVADRYGSGVLAPRPEDPARARFLYWMFYAPAVIEPAMSDRFNKVQVDRGSSGWGDFDSMISTLEGGIGDGPWISGEAFSAADVMLGSSVLFMRQFGLLPESDCLAKYAERCAARPGYQKARQIDEAAAA